MRITLVNTIVPIAVVRCFHGKFVANSLLTDAELKLCYGTED
jgi:hypothetical protein